MHVDRAKFLLLAGALAGCGGSQEPSPPAVIIADPDPTYLDDGSPDPAATPGPVLVEVPPTEPLPAPAGEGLSPPRRGGFAAKEDGMCRATRVVRPAAAGCNDDVGVPGSCAAVRLPGGCSSFPFICEHCEGYKAFFKPRIAQRAVECVVAQRGHDLGDGCRTYQCGDEALQSACPDRSADQPCRTIAAQCQTTREECRSLLSGMNAAGRARVASCAAQGCSFGIWSCIESM
jgi:hypothetical protein